VNTAFDDWNGQFSPDGRWVAYQSNQSGRDEIYVRPFPGPGIQHQISTNGGSMPRWRTSGEELYFIAPSGLLMAVQVPTSGPTFEVGDPTALFQTRIRPTSVRTLYAVAPDGRFLFSIPDEGGALSPITLSSTGPGGRNSSDPHSADPAPRLGPLKTGIVKIRPVLQPILDRRDAELPGLRRVS